MIQRLVLALIVLMGFAAQAVEIDASEQHALEIAEGHNVFYRYHPAEKGEPTIVLMNGLIYDLNNWNAFYEEMKSRGFGVLQTAYSTQPESLRTLETDPFFAETSFTFQGPRQEGIEIQTLVDETMAVVDHLGIDKFSVLTLSFGSIPGSTLAVQQKDRIKHLILSAPAVMASHRYNAYGASRHLLYSTLPSFYEYYYDAELYNTMLPLVLGQGTPEGVENMDFFHGVYQMARSTKWFDLKDMAEETLPKTHLFLASREDPTLYPDQIRFWELMESNPAKGKMILFEGAPHALPGVVPAEVAEQTEKLIRGRVRKPETIIDVDPGGMDSSASTSDEMEVDFLSEASDDAKECVRALKNAGNN